MRNIFSRREPVPPPILRGLPYDDGTTILRTLLHDVKKGFYIDVGANDPVVGSVTKPFYDEGWHGINVEPLHDLALKLILGRPRDTTLEVAAQSFNGTKPFHEVIDGLALSTDNDFYSNEYLKRGRQLNTYPVECSTLDLICSNLQVEIVHFLKIDAEGAEKDVLAGFSFKVRPWVVCVESVNGLCQVDTSSEWEGIILSKGYELCFYDGLCRFYLANEHRDLRPNLFIPRVT
jgi:FkbM family methyltransferase